MPGKFCSAPDDPTRVVSQFLKSYPGSVTDALDGPGMGSIKGHASVNRIKSPSLVETEYVDQTEGMIAQGAIPFSQLVHPDNFSNVIKSTSLISC